MSREDAAGDWSDFFWECECGRVNVREDETCQRCQKERE